MQRSFETVLFDLSDGIATITLNRPNALNAINPQLTVDMVAALKLCEADDVRVVVVKGAGRAFGSGDDLKEPFDLKPQDDIATGFYAPRPPYYNVIRAMRRLRKPVIAQVHGYCVGASLDLALGCDIVFAAEDARLGMPNTNRGLTGPTYMLSQAIGYHRTAELVLVGDLLTGTEAERLGIVNHAAPAARLDEAVMGMARRLATGATRAKGLAKMALNLGMHKEFEEGSAYHGYAVMLVRETEDVKEGRQAFLEKREPRFKGR
ncbi:MAG: enoyl-CoA hydratase/isomerase family protein [Chloroflexi bacterium]|nr:enoyl-CoA hydratase/isomerase family protein [Chloroflexota bacterium]